MDMAYLPVSPGGTPHFGADRRLAYPSAPGPKVPCSPGHGLTRTCRRELLALERRVTHTYFVLCGTWGCSARAQHPAAPSLLRTPCSAACEEGTARTVDGLPADASLAGRIPSMLRLSATAA